MGKKLDNNTIKHLNSKGIFNVYTADGVSGLLTTPNVNMPSGILTMISPEIVEVITRKRTADEVIGERRKVLDWEQNDIQIPIIEHTGDVSLYSDFENAPVSNINTTFVSAGHYRFTSALQVGSLEEQQYAKANMSAREEKNFATLESLAIEFNNVAFFGKENVGGSMYKVHGLLNNPDMPAYIGLETDLSQTNPAEMFNTVYTDIINLVQEVINNAKGHVDFSSTFVLSVSNKASKIFTARNQLGLNVRKALEEIYPNLQIVFAPELDDAYTGGKQVMYLRAEETGLSRVNSSAMIGFSELAIAGTQVQETWNIKQGMASGIAGVVIRRPYMWARGYMK